MSPIARALYWRDYHDRPDRAQLTRDALERWIVNKHNSLVTRIDDDKMHLVKDQIANVVKRLPKTPLGIRAFWSEVVANDLRYPAHKISLVDCIDAGIKSYTQAPRDTSPEIPITAKGNTYNICSTTTLLTPAKLFSLPPAIEERLHAHLQNAETRKGAFRRRVAVFAKNLLIEIGLHGTRTIDGKRMNALAGLGNGRKHVVRYKKLLVGAGILRPGWEKTYSKARKRASRYDLTPWALEELRRHVANS